MVAGDVIIEQPRGCEVEGATTLGAQRPSGHRPQKGSKFRRQRHAERMFVGIGALQKTVVFGIHGRQIHQRWVPVRYDASAEARKRFRSR